MKIAQKRTPVWCQWMRRVTYSRNVTLSLSRTCRCHCKYCSFATHKPHLHEPDEVERLIDRAARRGIKELLVLTGEAPAVQPRLDELGFADFTAYVVWACERALERGVLPHTNLGVVSREELVRLRAVTASQGLMLESTNPDLVAHQGSPTKHPDVRLDFIRTAGELKIPFTSGILVGIGESEQDRMESLEALAGFEHIQEIILQNYVPHRRYYGEEPAEIATEAAERYWRTGLSDVPHRDAPAWACPVTIEDMVRLVKETRRLMPEVGIQIPPNLADWWPQLVEAGATDLGGLSANGDHISPEHPFPSPLQVRKRLAGIAAPTERLCVYPQYMTPEWVDPRVLAVIEERYRTFTPRRGQAGARPETIAAAREGMPLTPEELEAMFAESRPEVIEDMRQAADELRAELAGDLVTFVVNRNINVSNVCTVGCAFCGFGVSRRSPDAYEHSQADFVRRIHDAISFGATEICMQSGIHPDWGLEDYLGWLRLAKETAPDMHLHAYSPMEVAHMCDVSGLSPHAVFEQLREAGLGSVPGTAAEVLEDGVRQRISPNKLPAARWVEIITAAHEIGLRSTVTVMFGHIETPAELAEHMRVVRTLQERTGGFTEFVPLSFIPFQTQLGRKHGIQEISREENLKHTAVFRLALGRTIPSLQASWVKMGLDAATEALRWGVNDLGGTLMEESISRMAGADHGVKLDPEDLVGAAHRAGRPAAERSTLYTIRRRYDLAQVA
jgi:FO synthase